MAYRKHDVQEARLHMMDVMEIGEKKFEAFPNDPNVDLVFNRLSCAKSSRLNTRSLRIIWIDAMHR